MSRSLTIFSFRRNVWLLLISMCLSVIITPDVFSQKKSQQKKTSASLHHSKSPQKKSNPKNYSSQKKQSVKSKHGLQKKNQKQSASSKRKKSNRKHHSSNKNVTFENSEIRLKNDELNKLRQEITVYQQKLSKSERVEKNTLNRLDDFDKQTGLIRKLVSQLNLQVRDNQSGIEIARLQLHVLENKLARLKEGYGMYIRSLYVRGPLHDTELLLSSGSLNQMFIRARYLKAYTEKQKSTLDEIRSTVEKIRTQKGILEDKITQQKNVIAEKKQEESLLKEKTNEHKRLLAEVRKDKERYQQQLDRKQAAMREIEQIISTLIENERRKREEKRRHSTEHNKFADRDPRVKRNLDMKIQDFPTTPLSETAFGKLKGHLPWPVSSGSIIGNFGNQVHPTLKTVTINKGIDIGVSDGSAVKAVADGTVSVIRFIPGFGNSILINHDDGFITVYAHLSHVLVKENQRVQAGQKIAVVGESMTGPQLHFQIWREKIVQNPMNWLARR